jgi:two-component system, cell cycle sensor histidine kinase and response regulator CckA
MTSGPTANILIVDDDRKSLMAMEALLAGPGRKIVTAESGAEALRCLLREDFALILLDVRIPDMDGFETAALIRRRERSRYTPIIFISAIDTLEADVFRGVASGAVDYLFKPVVPQVLKAKVAVFVDLFQMNERLKQQVIRQSEERFRLVIESLQDYAVFMMDPEGRVTLWNRSAENIRGWKQEEILGCSFAHFCSPEEQAENRPAYVLRQTVLEGRHEEEGWHRRNDGSQFWANTVYTAVKDDKGELVGFSAVTRDLSARKQAEDELQRLNAELEKHIEDQTEELIRTIAQREKLHEQLLQAQKMESIGTLAGGIAHDFNNLLNVILGYTALIEEHAAEPSQVAASLAVIQETVNRGGSLVRQLLALARKTETKFEPLQINRLLEGLRALLQETFPRTIDVCLRVDPDLPPLMGDSNQLHQALLNLCLNSRDAMPDGGGLTLGTCRISGAELRAYFQEARDQQYVNISVTDTGCGIDGTARSRVFEPFFTTKPQGQGTGLGLSVVYGIVASHRGFIDLASEPGQGTKFDIYLPLPADPVEALEVTARQPAASRKQRAGGGETILFVEDEPRQLILMQKFLASEGFNVLTAKDGAEAVQIHLQNKQEIALVVLDLGLPKLNGWEAYKLMKETDPRIKAIFATGFMSHEIEAHLEKGELSAVIMKPYQLHEVATKICSVIKKFAHPDPTANGNGNLET